MWFDELMLVIICVLSRLLLPISIYILLISVSLCGCMPCSHLLMTDVPFRNSGRHSDHLHYWEGYFFLQNYVVWPKKHRCCLPKISGDDVQEADRQHMEVYINDVVVKSLRRKDHIGHLEEAFSVMQKYGMRLNQTKCTFSISTIFLGLYHYTKRNWSIFLSD